MAEQCEYENRKKMSTREWVMVCVLIVLFQLLLHYWTSESMNGGEVLAYVSFAGTIISIILAVLAIIYSFVQSQAQQVTSDSISREIFRLTNVTTKIDESSQGVTRAVSELPAVMEQLSILPNSIAKEIDNAISTLSISTNSLHDKTEQMRKELLDKIESVQVDRGSNEHPKDDVNAIGDNCFFSAGEKSIAAMIIASYMVFSGKTYASLFSEIADSFKGEQRYVALLLLNRADSVNESYYMLDYLERGSDGLGFVFNNDDVDNAKNVFKLKFFYRAYAKMRDKVNPETIGDKDVSEYFHRLFDEGEFNFESAGLKFEIKD